MNLPVRRVGEGTFFWLLFLVPAKKSDSRKARLSTAKLVKRWA
jgi:hypothetical protein